MWALQNNSGNIKTAISNVNHFYIEDSNLKHIFINVDLHDNVRQLLGWKAFLKCFELFFCHPLIFVVDSIINPRRVLKVHKLWEHLYTASGCNCIWSLEYKWKMGSVKKFFQEILPPPTNFEIVSCCSNQNYLKLSLSNLTTSHKFSNTRTHIFQSFFMNSSPQKPNPLQKR